MRSVTSILASIKITLPIRNIIVQLLQGQLAVYLMWVGPVVVTKVVWVGLVNHLFLSWVTTMMTSPQMTESHKVTESFHHLSLHRPWCWRDWRPQPWKTAKMVSVSLKLWIPDPPRNSGTVITLTTTGADELIHSWVCTCLIEAKFRVHRICLFWDWGSQLWETAKMVRAGLKLVQGRWNLMC